MAGHSRGNFSVYAAQKPNQRNEERLVSEALIANSAPAAELKVYAPKPRELFPDRFGMGTKPAGIYEVLGTDHRNPDYRAMISGGFSGTSRPSGTGWW